MGAIECITQLHSKATQMAIKGGRKEKHYYGAKTVTLPSHN